MPVIRSCVVFIQVARYSYAVRAASSFDAAWSAIQVHEQRENLRLSDDAVVRVVVEGKMPGELGYEFDNARQPNYLHPVGPVRAWAEAHTKSATA